MRNARMMVCLVVVCVMAVVNLASAEIIQGINIDFVNIGNAGNAADPYTGGNYGDVGYNYRIGKYEVTANQWRTINTAAGIGDSGSWNNNQPVASISWYDAAQFCNYLTSGNKYSGAYKFDISGSFQGVDRISSISTYGTTYVIPTEDEWYKAAYFKPNDSGYSTYANGTSIAPINGVNSNYYSSAPWDITNGTMEQNGTFNMMGNVWEWNETVVNLQYGSLGIRGGSYHRSGSVYDLLSNYRGSYDLPSTEYVIIGFRVASVPEPTTLVLLGLGGWLLRRKKT